VDVLPNGPAYHPTVRVFLAGGVPEVMRHLRDLGLLDTSVMTVSGFTLNEVLDAWTVSARRARFRALLTERDGVDPDEVIYHPVRARAAGLTSTVTFLRGNLAPEGSIVKSTAIDPSVVDANGIFRHEGPARVFTKETAAVAAIKDGRIKPGDVMVLMGRGPTGSGMEETFQVTAALRYLPFGKHVVLITDARFSGVSTGACVGHVGPEALAGGPIGKVREGDRIRVMIDRLRLEGSIDLVGEASQRFDEARGAAVLASREPHPELAPDPNLPDDTRLWSALQRVGGGTWGGCVYDVDEIIDRLSLD
jgi:putative YjhG/YagF family dehydratase